MEMVIILVISVAIWMTCKDRITHFIASAIADAAEESEKEKLSEPKPVQTEDAPILETVSTPVSTEPASKIHRLEPLPPITAGGIIGGSFKILFKFIGYCLVFLLTVYVLVTYVGF